MPDADGLADCFSGSCAAGSGGEQEFPPELVALWADPEIWNFALRRAGDPDLAQDALLHAVCAVARIHDLERINDLRAYLCRAVINEAYRLRGQLARARRYESASLDEMGQRGAEKPSLSAPRPVDEAAITRLMAPTWLKRFGADRDRLEASVPGRSIEPDRYRGLIATVAERLLRAALDGTLSKADGKEELQASFPDWFGQPGDDENTHHKHLSRARRDVQDVLLAVVNRDELLS